LAGHLSTARAVSTSVTSIRIVEKYIRIIFVEVLLALGIYAVLLRIVDVTVGGGFCLAVLSFLARASRSSCS